MTQPTYRCRCRQCYGLREYMENLGRPSYALLPEAPGCAYTRGPVKHKAACTGTYTCECDDCRQSQQRLREHRNKYRSGRA